MPCGDSPCGDSPCGDSPCGDSPCGDRPCGDKPCGDIPCGDRPCGDSPCGDSPCGDSPWPPGAPTAAAGASQHEERGPPPRNQPHSRLLDRRTDTDSGGHVAKRRPHRGAVGEAAGRGVEEVGASANHEPSCGASDDRTSSSTLPAMSSDPNGLRDSRVRADRVRPERRIDPAVGDVEVRVVRRRDRRRAGRPDRRRRARRAPIPARCKGARPAPARSRAASAGSARRRPARCLRQGNPASPAGRAGSLPA